MFYLLLNVLLALAWAALTGEFTASNLLLGFLIGFVVLWIARRAIAPSTYFFKIFQAIGFVFFFLWEMILANFRVAVYVLSPLHRMHPRIIAFPLDARSDLEITLLANLISLTPGTVTLDVSSDRRVLYIHVMDAPDAEQVIWQTKNGLERRVLALVRGSLPEGKDN